MSPAPASDEKVCPYCAETIKAAAIRCRYCHSDLGQATAAPEPVAATKATRGTRAEKEPEPKTAPGIEEQEPLPAATPESDDLGRWRALATPVATTVLAVVVLALVVAGVVVGRVGGDDGTTSDGQVVDGRVRSVALTQGSELVQDALSYSYQDFDRVRTRNAKRMSAGFRKQYDAAMGKAEKKTKRYQVTLKTTVVASGLQSISAHRAKVLLFINQVTSAESGPDKTPTTQLNRTVVTLVRGDGDWRIDGIDPLAGDA